MGRPHIYRLLCLRVGPPAESATAWKYESMCPVTIDDRKFKLVVERRTRNGVPIHQNILVLAALTQHRLMSIQEIRQHRGPPRSEIRTDGIGRERAVMAQARRRWSVTESLGLTQRFAEGQRFALRKTKRDTAAIEPVSARSLWAGGRTDDRNGESMVRPIIRSSPIKWRSQLEPLAATAPQKWECITGAMLVSHR